MHALRRTYKSTEKGESSKEQIKDVVDHGDFVFGSRPLRVEFSDWTVTHSMRPLCVTCAAVPSR